MPKASTHNTKNIAMELLCSSSAALLSGRTGSADAVVELAFVLLTGRFGGGTSLFVDLALSSKDGTAEETTVIVAFVGFEAFGKSWDVDLFLSGFKSFFEVDAIPFDASVDETDDRLELSCDDEIFQNTKKHTITAVH